ncbi:Xaa-Pro dipeptidase [Zooshikella marina]|uniref:Xaa-Pro dipeptidase n=1 Tax=Zooshikella ganghwensis TaxID=202772 RepID=UPI001BB05026|nr:Xaa-Pro dipeptidase [Zooshikella ganghwensis]MBU2704948.1 Xaa-Pro dipeptidase [Zooshikella ganghwensis]
MEAQGSYDWQTLYQTHVAVLMERLQKSLNENKFDGVLIYSGTSPVAFRDDNNYPFKANPHFKHWLPLPEQPGCMLWITPGIKPILFFLQPQDFWHAAPPEPEGFWINEWDIKIVHTISEVRQQLAIDWNKIAFIGEITDDLFDWPVQHINPKTLLANLEYMRAYKTEYEQHCLKMANIRAVKGHRAAYQAWCSGKTEFETHCAYLLACQLRESQLPYDSIVAFNDHGAILHYDHYQTCASAEINSFLLDAGAVYNGYIADITRTYCADESHVFGELIQALDLALQKIISEIKPGISFVDLHEKMHEAVAVLLHQFEIVHLPVEQIMRDDITQVFFPHGLGHLIGVQTHDIGGKQRDISGEMLVAHSKHPFLRLLRPLDINVATTIEPGIYFIPMLLKRLHQSTSTKHINWALIDALCSFGGIRIEDTIIINEHGAENITRNAFKLISEL